MILPCGGADSIQFEQVRPRERWPVRQAQTFVKFREYPPFALLHVPYECHPYRLEARGVTVKLLK